MSAAWRTGNFEHGPYAIIAAGPAPTPRGGAPAVWLPFPDTATGSCMLLFGGMDPITGDTHTFGETKGWSELIESIPTAPTPRCHHTLIGDEVGGAFLFGGFSRQGRFNDTFYLIQQLHNGRNGKRPATFLPPVVCMLPS